MRLPTDWDLPQVIRDRLGDSAGRQRAMIEEGHLFIILHEAPKADQSDRVGAYFWRNPEGEWKHRGRGCGLSALKEHVKSYEEAVEALDRQQDKAHTAGEYLSLLEASAPLQRAALHVFQVLQNARDGMKDVRELIAIRDEAYEVSRTAELVHTDARTGLDCAVMRRSEEQAEASRKMSMTAHRLNVLAAIFLPLTALASIFGMNFKSGLEPYDSPFLFWAIVIASLFLGVFVGLLLSSNAQKPDFDRR